MEGGNHCNATKGWQCFKVGFRDGESTKNLVWDIWRGLSQHNFLSRLCLMKIMSAPNSFIRKITMRMFPIHIGLMSRTFPVNPRDFQPEGVRILKMYFA